MSRKSTFIRWRSAEPLLGAPSDPNPVLSARIILVSSQKGVGICVPLLSSAFNGHEDELDFFTSHWVVRTPRTISAWLSWVASNGLGMRSESNVCSPYIRYHRVSTWIALKCNYCRISIGQWKSSEAQIGGVTSEPSSRVKTGCRRPVSGIAAAWKDGNSTKFRSSAN